jgi:hypothetical protein
MKRQIDGMYRGAMAKQEGSKGSRFIFSHWKVMVLSWLIRARVPFDLRDNALCARGGAILDWEKSQLPKPRTQNEGGGTKNKKCRPARHGLLLGPIEEHAWPIHKDLSRPFDMLASAGTEANEQQKADKSQSIYVRIRRALDLRPLLVRIRPSRPQSKGQKVDLC